MMWQLLLLLLHLQSGRLELLVWPNYVKHRPQVQKKDSDCEQPLLAKAADV
jgi:hypothetical protein